MRGGLLGLLLCLTVIGAGARAAEPDASAQIAEWYGRGAAAYRRGDYVEATKAWSEVVDLCRAEGASGAEADALTRRAEAENALGHVRAGLSDLEAALSIAEAGGSPRAVAVTTGALGNATFVAGRIAPATGLLQRSLDIARREGFLDIVAASANNIGNAFNASQDWREAEDAYKEAIRAALAVNDRLLAAIATTNLGRLLAGRGDPQGGLAAIGQAHSFLDGLPATAARGFALVTMSQAAVKIGADSRLASATYLPLAYRALTEAASNARSVGDVAGASLADGELGALYERQARWDEALRLTRQAQFSADAAHADDIAYRWDWQSARILRAQGDAARALDSYRRAVSRLEAVRADIPVVRRAGRSAYREIIRPLYLGMADLLFTLAGKSDAQDATRLLTEAQEAVESAKQAELQDYFHDDCTASLAAKSKDLDRVAPRTVVLYPVILSDRIELLVTVDGAKKRVTVPVPTPKLLTAVRRLRAKIEDPEGPPAIYLADARVAYDALIRPIEPILEANHAETIVFIPDGFLRTVPLTALYDGARFVIDRWAVVVAPGLKLIDPKSLARQSNLVLMAGISDGVQGFVSLPHVADELTAVGRILPGQTLMNNQFTTAKFQAAIDGNPFTVIHLASHGEFGSDAAHSFILTYDGKLTMDGLERSIKTRAVGSSAIELLTLSACSTAAGDDDAPLGMGGIAVKSGARSALASLWPVSDQAAAALMASFYQALGDTNLSKAQALRQAQISLKADPSFAHPAFWSPFILIGNWL
jgi:CHAT domain-containing protein